MLEEYSLQRRVIELVLVSPGRCGPHPLVGPQAGQGVVEEREQHLVFVETPPARQDRMGVDLQGERRRQICGWMDGWTGRSGGQMDKRMRVTDRKV